jgi:hypothetical protein
LNIPVRIPNLGMRARTSAFFDKDAVKGAMSEMERKALSKASLVIKDRAFRIIKKRGLARIPRKLQEKHPGAGATDLFTMGLITGKERNRIIREVQTPPASPAGTPPYTHTPYAGHQASYLGFRRNLWNFYEFSKHAGVVGPSLKGRMIPYLHEFGGGMRLRTWVWIPQKYTKSGRMRKPITIKLALGQTPADTTKWRPTAIINSVIYPPRPFMLPAMEFCIANGSIARAFGGTFRRTSGPNAGYSVSRG